MASMWSCARGVLTMPTGASVSYSSSCWKQPSARESLVRIEACESRATGSDAGSLIDEMVGDAGLHVSDILGFYSSDWGDMVLRQHRRMV
jgi:hypothetical protein